MPTTRRFECVILVVLDSVGIGATIAENFSLCLDRGTSFLREIIE